MKKPFRLVVHWSDFALVTPDRAYCVADDTEEYIRRLFGFLVEDGGTLDGPVVIDWSGFSQQVRIFLGHDPASVVAARLS